MIKWPNIGLAGELLPCAETNLRDINNNFFLIDTLLNASFKDIIADDSLLPTSPEDGDVYITEDTNLIHAWKIDKWVTIQPQDGWQAYLKDEAAYYQFDGTVWNRYNVFEILEQMQELVEEAQAAAASVQWQDVIHLTSADSPKTLTQADRAKLFIANTGGGDFFFNMPDTDDVELPFLVGIQKSGTANSVTINAADNIDGNPSKVLTDDRQGAVVNADDDGEYYSTDFGPSPKKLDKPAVDSANSNYKLMGSNTVPVWAHNGFKKTVVVTGSASPYNIGQEDIILYNSAASAGSIVYPNATGSGRIITAKKTDTGFNRVTLSGTGMTTNYLHTPEETATFQDVEVSTGVFAWVQIARKTDGYFNAAGLITSDWSNITFTDPVIMRQGANLRLITGFTFTGSPTGSSNFYIYLPTGMVQHPSNYLSYQGHGRIVDSGARAYDGVMQIGVTSRLILFTLAAVSSNFVTYDAISNSSPFSIANGDGGQIDTGWIKITDWSE